MSKEWNVCEFDFSWSMCVHLFFFFVVDFWHLVLFVRFCFKKVFQVWATALRPECPFFPFFFNFAIPTLQMPSLIWFIWLILWSAVPLFTHSKEKPLHSPIWFFRQLIVVFPFVFELPYWNRFDDSKAYCDVYNHPNFVLCLF